MTGTSETTLAVRLTLHEAGVISAALKYAAKMQKQYERSPNCFEKLHLELHEIMVKASNRVLENTSAPEGENT